VELEDSRMPILKEDTAKLLCKDAVEGGRRDARPMRGGAKKGGGNANAWTCQRGRKKGKGATTVCLEAGRSLVSGVETTAGTSPTLTVP